MAVFQIENFDLDLFIKSFEDAGATVTKGTGGIFVDDKEVDIVDVLKSTFGDVSEPAVELYELSDGFGETVHVKPCRRCYEKHEEITKPEFVWFSDDINFINYYMINCPKCRDECDSSCMYGTFRQISEIEKKWNDWDKPLEEWEEDLDW